MITENEYFKYKGEIEEILSFEYITKLDLILEFSAKNQVKIKKLSKYLPFSEAKEFVKTLNLKNISDWKKYCKSGAKPINIPKSPVGIYKNDWISYPDWLGSRIANKNKEFLSYDEAKKFAIKLNLKRQMDWRNVYCKSGNKPANIPANPEGFYKNDGWKGWGDFLGTGNLANHQKNFLPYEEAKAFATTLKLRTQKSWLKFCKSGKRPANIPANPYLAYKDQWKDWKSFLIPPKRF